MRIHRRIKNLTEPEKEQFEKYLAEKLERIKPYVDAHHPDADTVKIDARIEKHEKHTAFEFKYELEMPRKRLVAAKTKHGIKESMDLATDKLEASLRKHFKKLTSQ